MNDLAVDCLRCRLPNGQNCPNSPLLAHTSCNEEVETCGTEKAKDRKLNPHRTERELQLEKEAREGQ